MLVSVRTCACRIATCFALSLGLYADPIPQGWAADNIKPIGYSGLDGRGGAFKMAIKRVNDRWYMFLGHLWHSGWTILDVTDSANPKFLKFVEGPANTNTIQMEFHDNIMVTALQRRPPNWGGHPNEPNDEGALIWGYQRRGELEAALALEDRRLWHPSNRLPRRQILQRGGDHAGLSRTDSSVRGYQRSHEAKGGWTLVDAGSERRRRSRPPRYFIPWSGDGHARRKEGLPRVWPGGRDSRH